MPICALFMDFPSSKGESIGQIRRETVGEGMDQDGAPSVMHELDMVSVVTSRVRATEGVLPRCCFGLVGLIVSAVTAHFELLDACMHRVTEGDMSARVCSLLL